jgi:hypothetical protein
MGFSCGLAGLLLCILPVYFEAPYVFLMKFSYLSKKKKNPPPIKKLISTTFTHFMAMTPGLISINHSCDLSPLIRK